MVEFFQAMQIFVMDLLAVDWAGLIGAAVASGVGLTVVTQALKSRFISVPATKYPRITSLALAFIVGLASAIAAGIEISSITSVVVFTVVAFITSGMAYDKVTSLVSEANQDDDQESPSYDLDHAEARTVTPVKRSVNVSNATVGRPSKRNQAGK